MFIKRLSGWGVVALCVALSACGGKEERLLNHYQKAAQHMADGDYEKARVEYKNVLQMEPKHLGASYGMGQTFEELNDIRSAVSFYQKTLELDPSHLQAKRRLARIFVTNGAHAGAAPLVADLLKVNPNDAAALTVNAAVKVKQGDALGAEEDVRAALVAEPDNLDAVFLLSSILSESDRKSDAILLLENAAHRNPKDVSLRIVLSDVYHQAGESSKAAAKLAELIEIEPKQLRHRLRLANYYTEAQHLDEAEKVLRNAIQENSTDTNIKQALLEFLFKHRTADIAKGQLDQFVAAEPDNASLRFSQARFAGATEQNAEAEKIYRELIERNEMNPDGIKGRIELARLLRKLNRVEEVQPLLSVVLKESPKNRDALLLRGDIALESRNPAAAIADYRAVLKEEPTTIPVHKALAQAHLVNGEIALAKDSLKNVLLLDENDVNAHIQLGLLYQSEGKLAQSLAELEKARELDPTNDSVLEGLFKNYLAEKDWEKAADIAVAVTGKGVTQFYQGMLALAQGNEDEAAAHFIDALEGRPDWVQPLSAMASLYVKDNKAAASLKYIDAAIKADPTNALVHNLRGEVLLSIGKEKSAKAAESFARAINQQPNFAPAYRNLAITHLIASDIKKAKQTYHNGIVETQGDLGLYLALASLQEKQQEFDDAIATYEGALLAHQSSATAANNLAMLLTVQRGDTESLARAKTLVEPLRNSKNPAYLDTVGWVDYKLGDYASAIPALELALKLAPDSPLLQYHLGMAQAKQGNAEKAKAALAKALETEVKFQGRDEAESVLAGLNDSES